MKNIERLCQYTYLLRLDKPIGIFLLLWPTLWAFELASEGSRDLRLLFVFVAGVIIMRSAGCIINDIFDRDLDAKVERTAKRPIAAKKISVRQASCLFLLLLMLAFVLVLQLNSLTIYYAFFAVGLTLIYPLLKRFTHLPQLGLGLAFSWGIPMVFAATRARVTGSAWVLFFTALLWPLIYDTFYAMVDREDDLKAGNKSTAILFANNEQGIIGFLQLAFLLGLFFVGLLFKLQLFYYLSLILVGLLFWYQQKLIKRQEKSAYFKAFLNNNWVGLVIFIGILLSLR